MTKSFLIEASKVPSLFNKAALIFMLHKEVSFNSFSLEKLFNEFLKICESKEKEYLMSQGNAKIHLSLIPENNPLYFLLKNGRITLNINNKGYELKLFVLNNKFVDDRILLIKQKAEILYCFSKVKQGNKNKIGRAHV